MGESAAAYVSIFLQPGWIHEAYYGWSVLAAEPGRLKLLQKRRGPIRQNLLLAKGVGDEEIASLMRDFRLLGWSAITTLHDFSADELTHTRTVCGKKLDRLDSGRMLNVATYAVDLGDTEQEMWSRVSYWTRTNIKRARRAGYTTTVEENTVGKLYPAFVNISAALSIKHHLAPVDLNAIQRTIGDGRAFLAGCLDPNGVPVIVHAIYTAESAGYSLLGGPVGKLPPGCGALLLWESSLGLKARGFRWYDLGGVPPDPENGIHRFKASLGGTFVDLGREYRFIPPVLGPAYAWIGKWRRR